MNPYEQYHRGGDYLFYQNRLCIPRCSFRKTILQQCHNDGIIGHFDRDKTLSSVKESFYWPKMARDVERHIRQCWVCHINKTQTQNASLYTLFHIPVLHWVDVSLDFDVGLLWAQQGKDFVMVVADYFSKMTHFSPYHKTIDVSHIVNFYFKEIVHLHIVLRTITLNRDVKFLSHFWRTVQSSSSV